MKVSDLTFTKTIHFPVIQAVPSPPLPWYKKLFSVFIGERRKWEIMEDYIIWSEYLQSFIFLPTGFIYDGASVPKLLNSIYSPTGSLFLGSGPHDLGYRYEGLLIIDTKGHIFFQRYSRKTLDHVFHDFCTMESHLNSSSHFATLLLRIAGIPTWRSHRKHSYDIYKDFPTLHIINYASFEDNTTDFEYNTLDEKNTYDLPTLHIIDYSSSEDSATEENDTYQE
jgi:hypothetical protein